MRAFANQVMGMRIDGQDSADLVELATADGHVHELTADPHAAVRS
jgi:hypothetical protein